MVYTLTLNPALDYDVYVENFAEEKLNLSKQINIRAGGKGINVSNILHGLGIETKALGFIGGFTGEFIKTDLENKNIPFDFVPFTGNTRLNIKINNNGTKETEIAGISPAIGDDEVRELMKRFESINSGDCLVLSGSIPAGVAEDIYKRISIGLSASPRLILDTRGRLIERNLHHNFLIKPNIGELEEMLDKPITTDKEIVDSCQYFLERGVENIIVSKGGGGALFVDRSSAFSAPSPQGVLINSIGAGDSMVAGFVAGALQNRDKRDAFRLAVACGSATAYSLGLAEKELIESVYEKVHITNI